jgi:predicted enzyme related to lactoylglutathione lyase
MNNRVIHFEVQADDVKRAKKFYEKVLGWKIEPMMTKENGGMDYWGISTGEGVPGINGGLYERPAEEESKYYVYDCTVSVSDIDKAIEAVKANGGTITKEKSEIPHVGWFANAKDTEGNRFGLMQPTEWKAK